MTKALLLFALFALSNATFAQGPNDGRDSDREAIKNDPVCVEPARHDAVHRMNLALYNVH